ncbi:hypothetical protein LL295_20400 [Vibrio campbellii]|uniref:hypothetical protein n=1 Tax=Vibrio campbellii TaxID=680 RepID=UPI001D17803E|nr:hypothetical protein [Vibrio campbellii]MCC4225854.1 hypothetical protein [Vibrio campbellii]
MKLDFEKCTKVETGYCLVPQPHDDLKKYSDLYDRFCSVIYMSVMVGDKPVKANITREAKDVACIRAALCELISIEDYIKQSYPALAFSDYQFYKSQNPILHMFKLLRNYNIHLSHSMLGTKPMKVMVPASLDDVFEIEVEYISNLSVSELRRLHSSKDYSDEQLSQMIECFEVQQHEFGVTTLIIKAALDYSEQITTLLKVGEMPAHQRHL